MEQTDSATFSLAFSQFGLIFNFNFTLYTTQSVYRHAQFRVNSIL
jgi:hypothetical protein